MTLDCRWGRCYSHRHLCKEFTIMATHRLLSSTGTIGTDLSTHWCCPSMACAIWDDNFIPFPPQWFSAASHECRQTWTICDNVRRQQSETLAAICKLRHRQTPRQNDCESPPSVANTAVQPGRWYQCFCIPSVDFGWKKQRKPDELHRQDNTI